MFQTFYNNYSQHLRHLDEILSIKQFMKAKPAHLIEQALLETGIQGGKQSNLQCQKAHTSKTKWQGVNE
jgi:hypothetical protein